MNSLLRWKSPESEWDPFRELEDLRSRLTQVFGRSPLRSGERGEQPLRLTQWAPLVDISEDEKEYLVKVELPEMKKEDITVNVENGVLSIRGERKFEKEEKTKKFHRVERAYGTFERSFTLPEGSDPGQVHADYKEGLLCIHLPKSEKAKPKAVEVKVS